MIKTSISLQDLRRRIYRKAKADKAWRFWGLYVHVCNRETLREAYAMAKKNDGAPGIDGVTFEAIEQGNVDGFLEQIRDELISGTYYPKRNRKKEIPKGNGKTRTLSIPTIRDRVVQGALKLILEPVFEADFQEGSHGYRPGKTAAQAVVGVGQAIVKGKARVIDLDLRAYFDTVRHDLLLKKISERINDERVLRLLKLILKASGQRGVPQGGVISPLLSNVYLNEVDKMLERAKEVTREKEFTHLEYARFADDLVILVDSYRRWDWLFRAAYQRLRAELAKLDVEVNAEKTRLINLARKGESFGFLGFDFRRITTHRGKQGVLFLPKMKARTALLDKLRGIFRRFESQPVRRVIAEINPVLRGWVNYFRIGHSSRCFGYVKQWVERKIRRHMMRAKKRQGFGWKRWSRDWLYRELGLYATYRVRHASNSKVLSR